MLHSLVWVKFGRSILIVIDCLTVIHHHLYIDSSPSPTVAPPTISTSYSMSSVVNSYLISSYQPYQSMLHSLVWVQFGRSTLIVIHCLTVIHHLYIDSSPSPTVSPPPISTSYSMSSVVMSRSVVAREASLNATLDASPTASIQPPSNQPSKS